MDPKNGRHFNPWPIAKSFTQEFWSKPANQKSNNYSDLVIEISNEKENKLLPALKSFCFPQYNEGV